METLSKGIPELYNYITGAYQTETITAGTPDMMESANLTPNGNTPLNIYNSTPGYYSEIATSG